MTCNTDATPLPVQLVTPPVARKMVGNISEPTLSRWIAKLDFPRPRYINGRRLFDANEIAAWVADQSREQEPPAALDRGRELAHANLRQQAAERRGGGA